MVCNQPSEVYPPVQGLCHREILANVTFVTQGRGGKARAASGRRRRIRSIIAGSIPSGGTTLGSLECEPSRPLPGGSMEGHRSEERRVGQGRREQTRRGRWRQHEVRE